jgi:hypothetical protein
MVGGREDEILSSAVEREKSGSSGSSAKLASFKAERLSLNRVNLMEARDGFNGALIFSPESHLDAAQSRFEIFQDGTPVRAEKLDFPPSISTVVTRTPIMARVECMRMSGGN